LLCYALDDGPVQAWRQGESIAPLLAIMPWVTSWVAHNIAFDRSVWNVHMVPLGLPSIAREACDDTMARCRAIGIPAGLDAATKILFPTGSHKADKRIMREMALPRRPWPGEDRTGLYKLNDAEHWGPYIAYCKQDVEVLRALHRILPALPDCERPVWIEDQIVNQRGVYLDGPGIKRDCELIAAARQEANTRLAQLTGGKISSTDQTAKIREWLQAHGCDLPNMQARTLLAELRREDLAPEARAVIELRLEAAQAAAAKPIRMRAWRCEDGRARHSLVYWGATTGRWSGTGPQFQNFKKANSPDLADSARDQEDAA
jgi:DNA polymerase